MCGLVGFVNYFDRSFSASLASLEHRGPDSFGVWINNDHSIWLGHRRLSIIDLTDSGKQPMLSSDNRLVIVFNGEIYNYKELRKDLESRGCIFKSNSDTEVILIGWSIWGVNLLEKLHGMFAFAIFDQLTQKVYAARDRAGEKPFFYTFQNAGFAFASELKALLSFFTSTPKVNHTALHALLGMGYVPGEYCILEGYHKLEPGCYLEYDVQKRVLQKHRYWSLPAFNTDPFMQTRLDDELDDLLKRAVSRQLVADVPVGVLLSGGLDSSLITAYAAERVSQLKTYTVSFPGYGKGDEAPFARLIASHFGTDHTEVQTDQPEPELLFQLAHQFDEPMTDPSLVPTYLLSKAIRKHCTVALGGDGGDELFGGYDRYLQWLMMQHQWRAVPHFLRKMLSSVSQSFLPVGFKGRYYLQQLGTDFNITIPQIDPLFELKERTCLLGRSYPIIPNTEVRKSYMQHGVDLADRAMRTDFCSYMPDDILVKVDRASMLASLEVRAPLLDVSVIDFAFRHVPSSLKVTKEDKKILLKRVAARHLPESFDFKRKQGFVPPFELWMKEDRWIHFFKDHLLSDKNSWFRNDFIEKIWNGQKKGRFNKRRLFTLLMIELWRKEYNVSL